MSGLSWDIPSPPDIDMTPSEESLPDFGVASLRQSTASSGKLFGAEGGSGKLVCLMIVRQETACLGYIGNTKSRFCRGPKECAIGAHARFKFVYPDGANELVFIDSGGAVPSVWAAPYIELGLFGRTWERYGQETRTVTQWQTLMEAMLSGPSLSEQDVAKMGEATRVEAGMFTPYKKRRPNKGRESPMGSEQSYQDVESPGFIPLSPDEDMANQWKSIATNLDWLRRMSLAAQKGNSELEETIIEVTTRLEARVAELKAVLGNRPADMGTTTVFNQFAAQGEEIQEAAELFGLIATEVKKQSDSGEGKLQGLKTDVKSEIYTELNAALGPLRSLFARTSSQLSSPGDKLDGEFAKLRQEVARLDHAIQQQQTINHNPQPLRAGSAGLAWSVAGNNAAGAFTAPQPGQGGVTVLDIKSIEKKILHIEQKLDSKAVKIGLETFSSRQEAEAWLQTNCPTPGMYAYFLDFHSLMALSFGEGGTMKEIFDLQHSATKLKFATTEEAIISASFQLEVPAFFGKLTAGATLHSAKVLPGLQTHTAWDSSDGDHGLRYEMTSRVQKRVDSWNQAAEYTLPTAAHLVAQYMLTASATFIEKIGGWISTFFHDATVKGADPDETWMHITHTVREVCSILHDARKAGRGPHLNSTERSACSFWGVLQAHREMQILTARSLVSDPRISHILNLHLRDNAVMRSELHRVHEQIKTLQSQIGNLSKAQKKPAANATVGFRGGGRGGVADIE